MGLPIYKIYVQDSELLEIALVDEAAIEEDFLKFSKEDDIVHFSADKQIVSGLVMIPNKLIYRNDKFGERYVYYDEETVTKSAQLFLKNGMKFNQSHSATKLQLDVLESYLTKEQNEFNAPKGSWVITAKVNDTELWSKIKSEEFNGFSFQSLFVNELVQNFNKQNEMNELKEKLMSAINSILFVVDPATPMMEAPADVPVDSKPDTTNTDEFQKLFTDALEAFKVSLLAEVDAKLEAVKGDMGKVNDAVAKFAAQPISESVVTETVASTPEKPTSKAASYFQN